MTTTYECWHCGEVVHIGLGGILFDKYNDPECPNPNRADGRHEVQS